MIAVQPLSSPTGSSSSSQSRGSSSLDSQVPIPSVSDEELAQLSVRQLNQKLQGQNRDVVSYLKQKRRTLKNRGYALNCRVRRIQNQLQLEADNMMLKDQIRFLRQTVQDLQGRLHYYEPACVVPASEIYVPTLSTAYTTQSTHLMPPMTNLQQHNLGQ